jgi:hypothetical protein
MFDLKISSWSTKPACPVCSGYCPEPSLEKWPDWRPSALQRSNGAKLPSLQFTELMFFTETHQSALLGYPWKKKMIVCRSHGTPQINSPSPRCLLFQWTLILIQHLSVATYESWQTSPLKLPYVPTKWACKHASKFHVLRITYPLGIFNITNYTCMYSKLLFSIGDCTMFRGKL